jgi:hypothetical protein
MPEVISSGALFPGGSREDAYSPMSELNPLKEFGEQCAGFWPPGFGLREYASRRVPGECGKPAI